MLEDAVSEVEFAPHLPALAFARLPPCLWRGMGQSAAASSPPVFTQSFVLWVAQQCLRLELFAGKLSLSLSLFFSLWLSHSLGCYLTLAPSDGPQGIQAQSLP